MNKHLLVKAGLPLLGVLSLAACAAPPPAGPTVMVLPGKDTNFSMFRQDDAVCRNYASARIGGASPAAAANASGLGTAALTTGLGAAAGAVIGSVGGAAGAGAAIGGASGLLLGSMLGAQTASASAAGLQDQYNMAYAQCMTAKGNEIAPSPGAGAGGTVYTPYPAYPAYPVTPYYYSPYYYGYGPYIGFGWGG